jgi:predicted PP-loop superfamily ATPase
MRHPREIYKVSSYKYRSGAQKRNLSWQYKFGCPLLLTESMKIDRYSRKSIE